MYSLLLRGFSGSIVLPPSCLARVMGRALEWEPHLGSPWQRTADEGFIAPTMIKHPLRTKADHRDGLTFWHGHLPRKPCDSASVGIGLILRTVAEETVV